MNTITLTIAATPDNLKRLADAFGDIIDETLPADAVPAHRISAANQPKGETPERIKSAEIPAQAPEPAPEAPKEEKAVTLSDVRAKAAQLIKDEKREELKGLLDKFNVAKVTELSESDYAAFLEGLEGIA